MLNDTVLQRESSNYNRLIMKFECPMAITWLPLRGGMMLTDPVLQQDSSNHKRLIMKYERPIVKTWPWLYLTRSCFSLIPSFNGRAANISVL